MTRVPIDLPLLCRCGRVRGAAREVSPSAGLRFVCYCKDCQAFAHFLDRADVLDAAGSTDIFQMPPGRVTLTEGMDAVRSLCFSSRVTRWYADCCKTPIGNTASSPRFPSSPSLILSSTAKPPVVLATTHSARRCVASTNAPPRGRCRRVRRRRLPSASLLAAQRILGWWWRGLGRPNPFFDDHTNAPLSAPRILDPYLVR